jgi:hypothetical protein
MIKTHLFAAGLGTSLLICGIVLAQRPKENISGAHHPNLAAAQRLGQQAWEKIVAAQGGQ